MPSQSTTQSGRLGMYANDLAYYEDVTEKLYKVSDIGIYRDTVTHILSSHQPAYHTHPIKNITTHSPSHHTHLHHTLILISLSSHYTHHFNIHPIIHLVIHHPFYWSLFWIRPTVMNSTRCRLCGGWVWSIMNWYLHGQWVTNKHTLPYT